MRLYTGDFSIEDRPMMQKVNARRCRLISQREAGVRRIGISSQRSAIQLHRQENRSEEGNSNYRTADCRPWTVAHTDSIKRGYFSADNRLQPTGGLNSRRNRWGSAPVGITP